MKNNLSPIIFGIAIVLAAIFLGRAYVERSQVEGKIEVTGLGEEDFTSDLIVWEARFEAEDKELQKAYLKLESNKAIIRSYLMEKGVDEADMVFSAVSTIQQSKRKYTADGDYIGEEFTGYELRQSVEIESKEVEKVERLSREITELLNQGVNLYSQAPRYYYTKLADLKIEMVSKATEDARVRAEQIAENAGGKLGDLESARMGVFQITGQNSDENYSWGGTFNTSSKEKTASITMKLIYEVE